MRVKRRGAGLFSACFFGIPETDTRVENLGLGVFCVLIDDVLVAAVDVFSACGEMMADTLGHAPKAHRMPIRARLFALVLRTWPMANPPGHLAGGQRPALLDAMQRQANGQAQCGCGYRRHVATATPPLICGAAAPSVALPGGLFLAGFHSPFASSFRYSFRSLPQRCRACSWVSIKGAALRAFRAFYKPSPAHSRHPRGRHLAGERVDANGE